MRLTLFLTTFVSKSSGSTLPARDEIEEVLVLLRFDDDDDEWYVVVAGAEEVGVGS